MNKRKKYKNFGENINQEKINELKMDILVKKMEICPFHKDCPVFKKYCNT